MQQVACSTLLQASKTLYTIKWHFLFDSVKFRFWCHWQNFLLQQHIWWLQVQRYTTTNTKDSKVGQISVLGRNKDVFVTDMSFNSYSLFKTSQGCQSAIWILLQLLLISYTQDTNYHGSNTSHVHLQSRIQHATSTCSFIWDVLEYVACCRRAASGNSV